MGLKRALDISLDDFRVGAGARGADLLEGARKHLSDRTLGGLLELYRERPRTLLSIPGVGEKTVLAFLESALFWILDNRSDAGAKCIVEIKDLAHVSHEIEVEADRFEVNCGALELFRDDTRVSAFASGKWGSARLQGEAPQGASDEDSDTESGRG